MLAAIAPFAWMVRWQERFPSVWLVLTIGAIGVAAIWIIARASAWETYDAINSLLGLTVATGSVFMIRTLIRSGWTDARDTTRGRSLVVDSGAVAVALVVVVALLLNGTLPLIAVGGAGAILVVFILVRRSVIGFVDAFVATSAKTSAWIRPPVANDRPRE